jgi:hypothetical protein
MLLLALLHHVDLRLRGCGRRSGAIATKNAA